MLSRRWALLFILASFGVYIVWLKKVDPIEFISRQELFRTPWNILHQTESLPIEELEKLQVQRKEVILESCQNISDSTRNLGWTLSHPNHKASLGQIIVDDQNQLLYCYVPKVACTNWKRLLMVITGKANTSDLSSIDSVEAHKSGVFRRLSDYTEDEIRYRLDNYFKFMFVRHPFERILSAYRDKLNPGNEYFQRMYGRKIIQTYRLNASEESLLSGDGVTFQEFIRYLINFQSTEENGVYNEHWRPMADLCLLCVIRYDIVRKYETINDDAWFVLKNAGLSRRAHFPRVEKNSTTSSLIQAFLSQLTKREVEQLYHVYEHDFNLFGYDTAL